MLRAGEGGDDTTVVDGAAEDAVVSVLERVDASFTLVSEELGERVFGADPGGVRVVVDPIDGSLNAKRGFPLFALSIAVAEGSAMDDVVAGYVHDFGTGEEWTAIRGEGAWLDGVPLAGPAPEGRGRDPGDGGDAHRPARGEGGRDGRVRLPDARVRLAGARALPPRRRTRGRRVLAQAGPLGRHRRRAAPRPRARVRARPAGRSAVRRRTARPRGPLARRRRRRARRSAPSCTPGCASRTRAGSGPRSSASRRRRRRRPARRGSPTRARRRRPRPHV